MDLYTLTRPRTLGDLDFRRRDPDRRSLHPGLAAFEAVFALRPSLTCHRPGAAA